MILKPNSFNYYKLNKESKIKKGFTLVEVVIVLVLFILIGSFFAFEFFTISSDYNFVKTDIELIKEILTTAQQKAILAEDNYSWGVYFENTTSDRFFLFKGNIFTTSTIIKSYSLNPNNRFIYPSEGSSSQVIFDKFSGYTNTTSYIIISNLKNNVFATITINYFGSIDYLIK